MGTKNKNQINIDPESVRVMGRGEIPPIDQRLVDAIGQERALNCWLLACQSVKNLTPTQEEIDEAVFGKKPYWTAYREKGPATVEPIAQVEKPEKLMQSKESLYSIDNLMNRAIEADPSVAPIVEKLRQLFKQGYPLKLACSVEPNRYGPYPAAIIICDKEQLKREEHSLYLMYRYLGSIQGENNFVQRKDFESLHFLIERLNEESIPNSFVGIVPKNEPKPPFLSQTFAIFFDGKNNAFIHPKSMDTSTLKKSLEQKKENLGELMFEKYDEKIDPTQDWKKEYFIKYLNERAVWINNPDFSGVMLYDPEKKKVVTGKDNKPVRYLWKELAGGVKDIPNIYTIDELSLYNRFNLYTQKDREVDKVVPSPEDLLDLVGENVWENSLIGLNKYYVFVKSLETGNKSSALSMFFPLQFSPVSILLPSEQPSVSILSFLPLPLAISIARKCAEDDNYSFEKIMEELRKRLNAPKEFFNKIYNKFKEEGLGGVVYTLLNTGLSKVDDSIYNSPLSNILEDKSKLEERYRALTSNPENLKPLTKKEFNGLLPAYAKGMKFVEGVNRATLQIRLDLWYARHRRENIIKVGKEAHPKLHSDIEDRIDEETFHLPESWIPLPGASKLPKFVNKKTGAVKWAKKFKKELHQEINDAVKDFVDMVKNFVERPMIKKIIEPNNDVVKKIVESPKTKKIIKEALIFLPSLSEDIITGVVEGVLSTIIIDTFFASRYLDYLGYEIDLEDRITSYLRSVGISANVAVAKDIGERIIKPILAKFDFKKLFNSLFKK